LTCSYPACPLSLSGRDIPVGTHVEIATLTQAMFLDRINDLAFIVDNKLVILIEHQSTICENMALRLLLYIARVYEKIIDKKAIYRNALLQIPRPEFYVLYNGKDDYPEIKKIRLSDAFADLDIHENNGMLELEVTVFNVNAEYNKDIIRKSDDLNGYVIFVAKVREFQNAGLDLNEAITSAINYCINQDLLVEFMVMHASEVRNMLFTEFDLKTAQEVWYEEGHEKGILVGRIEGRTEGEISKAYDIAKKMLKRNRPINEIIEDTGLSLDEVNELRKA